VGFRKGSSHTCGITTWSELLESYRMRRLINRFDRLMQTPRVYLVAYAGAAFPIAELFRSRGTLPSLSGYATEGGHDKDVTTCLKGVAQVVGTSQQPAYIKSQGDALDWFVKVSKICKLEVHVSQFL
jgi:hypothetical protein